MEVIIYLYMIFTGCVYMSWLWDAEDPFWIKLLNILSALTLWWFVTPILIGRAIEKIYKGE